MNITDVRVKLVSDRRDKLLAYATITVDDCIVIRDLKIIAGPRGRFVAMPSRKLSGHCPGCGSKNRLMARFCNDCGARLPSTVEAGGSGRQRVRLYADIAHPIHQRGRDEIQDVVLRAYDDEVEQARRADYVPQSFDGLDYE